MKIVCATCIRVIKEGSTYTTYKSSKSSNIIARCQGCETRRNSLSKFKRKKRVITAITSDSGIPTLTRGARNVEF